MSLTKVSFQLIQGVPASILDFGAVGDGATDCTAALTAALASVAADYGTVYIPDGEYLLTDAGNTGFVVPTRCNLVFAPGAVLNYNGTAAKIFNIKNGTQFLGNGARINVTNTSWNGVALFYDGANRYADDYPCALDSINLKGADITKGTGLALEATAATNFISFVRYSNVTINEMNFGLTLNCGSSGDAGDVNTWHWINGNIFENFNFYGTRYGMNLSGLETVPAEVAGNFFNNFSFETPNIPVYTNGPSRNFFNNFYIWDWNFGSGNPVIFDGASVNNQFNGNIDPLFVTGRATNGVWHMGAGLFTKMTVNGDVWAYGTSNLRLGYAGYEATINGENQLILTPRSGYNTQVASQFVPTTDNTYSLGAGTSRWSVVYAATGTINTSDALQKQQFATLTAAEQQTAKDIKGLIRTFKFTDAVLKKRERARTHVGVSAQDVKAAFETNGLDATKYGLFCADTWYEVDGKSHDSKGIAYTKDTPNAVEITQLGIRYEELLAFVIAAL